MGCRSRRLERESGIYMSKIAIIGDKTTVLGFGALGLDTYTVKQKSEAHDTWEKASETDYSIIFVTENLYRELEEEIEKVRERMTPAVLVVPGPGGSTGFGLDRMKGIVEMAVGADILTKRESKA